MSTSGEITRVTGQLQMKSEGRRGTLGVVLRIRNFRLLWIGQGISVLGDQFYLIALPWLVLQLTGDALAVGTALALVAFPRALFMLVGGALIDRFSPRNVMLASDALRLALVTLLTLLFANADHFLTEVHELIDTAEPPVEWLLIDAEAIVDIDVTATEAISTLQCELERQGIVLAIARANHPLQKMLKCAGLTERIGAEHFYPTVRTGVQVFFEQQAK